MKDWIKIFSSGQLATASMIAGVLNENGIPAKMLDRKDSSYVFLGEVEIYIPAEFVSVATEIVNSLELNKPDA